MDRPGRLCLCGGVERLLLRDGVRWRNSRLQANPGSLVEVEAKVIYTGRTSMHVAVDVRAGDLMERRLPGPPTA
jgi:hypothetical protein